MKRLTMKFKNAETGAFVTYRLKDETSFEMDKAIKRLGQYEDLEENGLLAILPVSVGETVYVIAECSHINKKLDGTLYDSNGGYGTATGYYCPYEDSCPHDCDEFTYCEDYKEKPEVFEDTVSTIQIDESGLMIFTENLGVCGRVGESHIFLKREDAEKAFKDGVENEPLA